MYIIFIKHRKIVTKKKIEFLKKDREIIKPLLEWNERERNQQKKYVKHKKIDVV